MSTQTRRQNLGLGKTAAGGSGGSFASYERVSAAPPVSLGDYITALAEEQTAHEREWSAAEERLRAYRGDRIKSVVNWVDDSLIEDGAVRQADWRRAMRAAWQSGLNRQVVVSRKFPHLRKFLYSGQRSPDLAADCKAYVAESKREKKQDELAALCERYAKHGSKEHERDLPASLRADQLNTEADAGVGLTDEQMLRGKHLAEDSLVDAVRGELSDNEHANLLTLASTLEDQNFHAESITYEAIARIHEARRHPNQKITGTAAWVILSAQINVPDDIKERARRDDPNSAKSADDYRVHARVPFL